MRPCSGLAAGRCARQMLGTALLTMALALGAVHAAHAQLTPPRPLTLIDDPDLIETTVYVYDATLDVISSLEGNLEQVEEDLFDAYAVSAALPFEILASAGTRGLALQSLAVATTLVNFSVDAPSLVRLSWDFTLAGNGDPNYRGGQFILESQGMGTVLFDALSGPPAGSFTMMLQPGDTYYAVLGVDVENIALGELRSGYASLSVVPEPASALLLGLGVVGLLAWRTRQTDRV